jgi:hypothetical protein
MGPLAEYLKNEAEHLRTEAGKREEAKAEWLKALTQLYRLLDEWVVEADGGLRLLQRLQKSQSCNEPRLGVYEINVLHIGLGNSWVKVTPRARYVIANIRPPGQEPRRADGMVEIKSESSPEYYLFRKKTEGGDEWFIRNVDQWNSDPVPGTVEPLDRDRFEAALLRMFQ